MEGAAVGGLLLLLFPGKPLQATPFPWIPLCKPKACAKPLFGAAWFSPIGVAIVFAYQIESIKIGNIYFFVCTLTKIAHKTIRTAEKMSFIFSSMFAPVKNDFYTDVMNFYTITLTLYRWFKPNRKQILLFDFYCKIRSKSLKKLHIIT